MRPRALIWIPVALAAAAAARRRLDVVEVRGGSMAPTLQPGDRLVVLRTRRPARVGDVVLAADPRDERRELIKRVAAAGPAGWTLRGDNQAASTDARIFGLVPPSEVRWRAIARYWPPRRAGRIPAGPPSPNLLDEGGETACAFPEALIAGDLGPPAGL